MLKKILATVSAAALVAGAASALEVVPQVTGTTAGFAVPLAAELDYAGGAVETTTPTHDELRFSFFPSGGVFPTGNVVLRVEVTGAEFSGALDGSEVTTVAGTSVVSTGGVSGGSVVNFLLSDTSGCAALGNCFIDLPLTLTSGNVSVAVGLETDAGVPVDNSALDDLVTARLAFAAPAFDIDITADTTLSEALLPVNPGDDPFVVLSDSLLGNVSVAANVVDVNPGAGVSNVAVRRDLIGTAVDAANVDVDSVTVVVTGDMDPFTPNAPVGNFIIGGANATVSAAARTATRASATAPINWSVAVAADGVTTIDRSTYIAAVTVEVTNTSVLTAGTSATAPLEPITREGTEIVFPWTQSATQGAASGATSVFRIGNLSDLDTGAVFAEVRNSSDGAFTSTGIEQISTSIDAGGEFVINSAQLEAALGDYSRGDVSFIIEADDTTLTGRQFVVRNGNIQQVIGGTVFQDQN